MALTRLQRRSRRRRRTPSRGFLPCATGRALSWCSGGFSWCTTAVARFWCSVVDLLCGSNKKRAITLGVLVAVTSFINIVLYRVDERSRLYSSEKKSCACPRHEDHLDNGAAQDSSVSLLKPTWCLRQGPVSLSGDEYRWQTGSTYGGGLSCACARREPGTEDSSSWKELLPHLRPTQCLRTELLTLDEDTAYGELALSEAGRRVRQTGADQPPPDNPKRFTGYRSVLGKEGFTSGRHYWELQLLQDDGWWAHGELALSEEGRRVRDTDSDQRRPSNPKRFTASARVLGKEGFTSGRHYWELQLLGQDGGWAVGVARESVSRKGGVTHSPEGGVWAVEGYNGQYQALTSPPSRLSARQRPLKLGFYLDYEGGLLSLYNADTLEELLTFSNATFMGRVCPYFYLWETDLRLV